MKKISLFVILTIISFVLKAQTFMSVNSDVYFPDSVKQDWIFGYKLNKENIPITIVKDTLYIDNVKFILGKKYETQEDTDMLLNRYIAYNNKEDYHFDVFSSKKVGEQNIRLFYLTNNKINYRYFCIKLIK